jgi:3-isopropylmalate dehydrogenase
MKVVILPGDGIGPEIAVHARRALERLAPDLELEEHVFGAAAIRQAGTPLPQATLDACLAADAVLKGPIGDPEFDAADVRPEQGLLGLRKALDVYANLRPSRADGIDLVIVRELVGGLYFGAKGTREDGTVFDTCEYHPDQVERLVRHGFAAAQARRGKLTSVDKANVLETSRMWRRVVDALRPEYPDVEVEHMLVDNAAMQLVRAPEQFDVVVTENTFGDILSDIAAEVTGGLGLAGSASLGESAPGLFEPVHGSAPDIAGRGIASPVGMLRSTALLLEYGLGRSDAARSLDAEIDGMLAAA